MKQNNFMVRVIKYECLLPTIILAAVNNTVFYIKKPELEFEYYDYILSVLLSALVWSWFYCIGLFFKGWLSFSVRSFAAILFAVISSVSYIVYFEFGQFVSFAMLSFLDKYPEYLRSFAVLYLKEYWLVFLLFFIPVIIPLFKTTSNTLKKERAASLCLMLPAIILVLISSVDLINKKNILLPDVTILISVFKKIINPNERQYGLEKPKRDKLSVNQDYSEVPDIYMIINESLGRKSFKFNGGKISSPCMPFLGNLVNGDPNHWFVFENSLSSSTATDVSIPSILTGLAPTAERSQYHKIPLIWDFLKSINPRYYTIFSSPVDFKWANLENFLNLQQFDKYIQSINLPGNEINDLGKDEYYSATAFAKAIKEAPKNQPIYGFYFSNSLHSPYQKESVYVNEDRSGKSRFCIAQEILDKAIKDIIMSIIESNRMENSIIFVIGDHGDSDKPNENGHRLYSFREEYWSTILLVYASDKIQSQYFKSFDILRKNTKSLVGTIDIYPSIVDLFSHFKKSDALNNKLDGFSLFQEIPVDRVMIGLSTNGLRRWPQEGFGIARGQSRMIYNNVHGFSFHDLSTDPNQENDTLNLLDEKDRKAYLDIINNNSELLRVFSTN